MDATWDSYWYSLYNMSANISMSANGVLFPHNEEQQAAFENRFPKMLQAANRKRPPVENANLNMAAFTDADPHFTQQPAFGFGSGGKRPNASTLAWTEYSGVVSPSSLAWTHLKGVTWAKNFQNHADILPSTLAPLFRAEVLATLAQLGITASLIAGGPESNGALTKGDSLELVSEFNPSTGKYVDETTRPNHHSAMLWFLSDMTSLTAGGWFGYEQPQPLIPPEKIRMLTDGMAETTMNAFSPSAIVEMGSTRDLGQMLERSAGTALTPARRSFGRRPPSTRTRSRARSRRTSRAAAGSKRARRIRPLHRPSSGRGCYGPHRSTASITVRWPRAYSGTWLKSCSTPMPARS
jgi:hypothetical protein